jgi:hypothetical protein
LYPCAKEVLDVLYDSQLHRTILWTSSHHDAVTNVTNTFGLKFHYFNENPECSNTEMCDFGRKFYFNILIDDKAGFDGNYDWWLIKMAFLKYHPFN